MAPYGGDQHKHNTNDDSNDKHNYNIKYNNTDDVYLKHNTSDNHHIHNNANDSNSIKFSNSRGNSNANHSSTNDDDPKHSNAKHNYNIKYNNTDDVYLKHNTSDNHHIHNNANDSNSIKFSNSRGNSNANHSSTNDDDPKHSNAKHNYNVKYNNTDVVYLKHHTSDNHHIHNNANDSNSINNSRGNSNANHSNTNDDDPKHSNSKHNYNVKYNNTDDVYLKHHTSNSNANHSSTNDDDPKHSNAKHNYNVKYNNTDDVYLKHNTSYNHHIHNDANDSNSIKFSNCRGNSNANHSNTNDDDPKHSNSKHNYNVKYNSTDDVYLKHHTSDNHHIHNNANDSNSTEFSNFRGNSNANHKFVCLFDKEFGNATASYKAVAPCEPDKVGEKTAVCKENGKFEDRQDNCIIPLVQELFVQSQSLNSNSLPEFLDELSNITVSVTQNVAESPATIRSIVQILRNVANASLSLTISISRTSMEDVLLTVGVLTTDGARESWNFLNTRTMSSTNNDSTAESVSSLLLQSLENITLGLTNGTFDIYTPSIILNKTVFTNISSPDFNSSVKIHIPESDGGNKSITVITFLSMDNVLPARDEGNSSLNIINGRVVLVQSNGTINNISLSFDVIHNTLDNPKCVFWNFSFFDGLGGWDDQGCELVSSVKGIVTCNCNHLTSFSILMSPSGFINPVLDYITYIGVGISIGSLVICLIVEAAIWRQIRKNNTSYLRHVSIVNIAVSLLIADIWFIIGAVISEAVETNTLECTAATFFIHFFYLSLFFWMLASGLLLLYRTVTVFEGGLSETSMLAIGFSLGYGAPIIIATITIAVTAPKNEYVQSTGSCWLNWDESKALLAFVIPVLSIVLINLLIIAVVIYKIVRRVGIDAAQTAESHVVVVIARSLTVLTPFFGFTWALGVGTLAIPNNRGIHIAFALSNSLQGFFILVFGTLLDKKVWSELAVMSQTVKSGTRSTSAGFSPSGPQFLWYWRRRRDGYEVSSGPSSSDSLSFINT
ncbi:adhesion G-protein coupled receptor F1-like [Mugil cephalus]|uniref:adhesion G-protein coupled receptor F1-like n=1 Tax=Mugil cephalus TaxID=48193 RepID=UPI001FB81B36|nr:adhesion G-protein coupled receptor F1-like [Mugil cephalus]